MIYLKHCESPLGAVTVSSDGDFITGLWFDGQKYDRALLKKEDVCEKDSVLLRDAVRWLDIYFQGRNPEFTVPVKEIGSPFKQLIADIMLSIPFGGLMTYGEIAQEAARRLGKNRMSAQAVGGAVGHNYVSILIPCHRVVGTNGSLTGYAGGIERKVALLKNEGVDFEKHHLFIPIRGTAL